MKLVTVWMPHPQTGEPVLLGARQADYVDEDGRVPSGWHASVSFRIEDVTGRWAEKSRSGNGVRVLEVDVSDEALARLMAAPIVEVDECSTCGIPWTECAEVQAKGGERCCEWFCSCRTRLAEAESVEPATQPDLFGGQLPLEGAA